MFNNCQHLSTKCHYFEIFQQNSTSSTDFQHMSKCKSLNINLVEKNMAVELVDGKYMGQQKTK